jgi:glycosyltransferase involved in cell wall biosynthesis
MIDLYSAADVVADDFGIGWIGSVVLEALAIGRPVLSYIDEGVMRSMYPWHPIVSCRTPEEIADCLLGLYRDPARRQEIGQRGRDWIKAFHDPSHVSEVYCEAVRSLAGRITWEARRPR